MTLSWHATLWRVTSPLRTITPGRAAAPRAQGAMGSRWRSDPARGPLCVTRYGRGNCLLSFYLLLTEPARLLQAFFCTERAFFQHTVTAGDFFSPLCKIFFYQLVTLTAIRRQNRIMPILAGQADCYHPMRSIFALSFCHRWLSPVYRSLWWYVKLLACHNTHLIYCF